MKTSREYQAERKKLAEILERFNDAACIHLAEILRTNDAYSRACMELGEKPESLIPKQYFEAAYRLLSFAPKADRLTLMTGTPDQIEALISKTQHARGFYTDSGFWIEL